MAKYSQANELAFQNVSRITLPIYYEDTDFTGYVFHANFLKYFDRAREEALGLKFVKELYDAGKHFVVRKAEINYLRPVKHSDTLVIESQVKYSDSPLVIFRHEAYVLSNLDDQNNPMVVEGLIELVSINKRGRPQRLPREVQEHFKTETANAAGVSDGKHNKH
ncbi:MAG: acyl-CoA thioesterase [Oligoflexales bacterium]